ncbi:MAG TPA: hypothetical protein VFZ23_18075 [Pyrinomonadaceae bacterium]
MSASRPVLSGAFACVLALVAFHLSLVTTSAPLLRDESIAVKRAIDLLDAKGFKTEVLVLRHTAIFRRTDHWLNVIAEKENAFAATNFPFQIITLYPDFHTRASDDTERAMILLHEARHLLAENEADAQRYVWRNRRQLGWTQLTHGTTQTYITVEQQTREHLPDLFTCPNRNWNDCTESLRARR